MNKRKFLLKIYNNNKNVNFDDFVTLVEAFGFSRIRVRGSHNIFARDDVKDLVNIQNDNGQAKPYQIKQFLALVEMNRLSLEDDNE